MKIWGDNGLNDLNDLRWIEQHLILCLTNASTPEIRHSTLAPVTSSFQIAHSQPTSYFSLPLELKETNCIKIQLSKQYKKMWFENTVCAFQSNSVNNKWKQWIQWPTLFLEAPKSLQIVTAAMKLKDACSVEEGDDQPRQHIKKQRHYFVNKGLSSQKL